MFCTQCGSESGGDARFCGSCGTAFAAPTATARVDGERRHVTVMFCDLVGSTALSEQLDPEDLGELVLGYQEIGREIVDRFGGSVAQFLGDGLLTYFGHPVAHEDDADRAVMAGLAILESLAPLRAHAVRLGASTLQARVGIHTGAVVVGAMGSTDRSDTSLFGSTTNIAARLEGFASPGSAVVSETTVRVLRGRYSLTDCGTPALKGIDRPVRVWSVAQLADGASSRRTPSDTPAPVGRATETAAMVAATDRARERGCQTVLITGEPGVGKSTLVGALFDALADQPHRWLEFQCSELAAASPLLPVITGLRRLLDIGERDDVATQRTRLEIGLGAIGDAAPDAFPFVADLLGIGVEDDGALRGLSPEMLRHRLLDALVEWALALADDLPLVLVTEDLHWADPTTVELLRRITDRAATRPVACVCTSRVELPEGWAPAAFTRLSVGRLGAEDSHALAARLAEELALPEEAVAELAARGDGVPLFIEELVREAADAGGTLPDTLQSVLAARLDRLGSDRATAQAASVLGRDFPVGLLSAVLGMNEAELVGSLVRLRDAGIVSSGWSADGSRYVFRHALIQDAAYASMLRRRRRALHARVAEVLTEEYPLQADAAPELVGHHYREADRTLDAARCFALAGRRAVERAALQESITHYEAGIELLRSLEAAAERDELLLSLLILLANAMMGTAGPGGSDVIPIWEDAMALAEKVGNLDELTSAMNGAAMYWSDRGDLDKTIELANGILEIAESSESRIASLRGHCTLGMAYLFRGDGARSLEHSEKGVGFEREGDFFTITYGVGHDQGVFGRSMASWALWWVGRPDASLAAALDADERAQRLPSSLSQALARHAVALARHLRRESALAIDAAMQNVMLTEELGIPFWLATALMVLGGERARGGDHAGLDDLDQAFAVLMDIGNQGGSTMGLTLLAEAQCGLGLIEEAVATADLGLTISQGFGQPFYDPELLRVKAAAQARGPDGLGAADATLRESLALADAMGARSFFLRSALDLATLHADDPAMATETTPVLRAAVQAMQDGVATVDQVTARSLLSVRTGDGP